MPLYRPPARARNTGSVGFNLWARVLTLSDLLFGSRMVAGGDRWGATLRSLIGYARGGNETSGFTSEVIARCRGKSFLINRDGGLGVLSCRHYEPECWAFMDSLRGDLFVDVGASVGGYVIHCADRFDRVIAVEPNPTCTRILRENIRLNDVRNVAVEEEAIGVHREVRPLYAARSLVNWSLEFPSDNHLDVQVVPLDELLDGIGHVRVVLVDVEGAELDFIKGALGSLFKIDYLLIEVRKKFDSEISQMMGSHGFQRRVLEERKAARNILFSSPHASAQLSEVAR